MIFFLNPSPIFCMAKHPAMLRGTAREEGNSSGLLHSRYFNRQKRNKKERVHRNDVPSLFRAEDEAQTRDPLPHLATLVFALKASAKIALLF